jgi:hypothetical protein
MDGHKLRTVLVNYLMSLDPNTEFNWSPDNRQSITDYFKEIMNLTKEEYCKPLMGK